MYPIDFFYRAARLFRDRRAIESTTGRITYAQLYEGVHAPAARMQRIDPEPQSRVGICARNNVEHIIALLATLAAGKTWIPLNPRNAKAEIKRVIDATEPTIIVADEDYLDQVEPGGATLLIGRVAKGVAGVEDVRTLVVRCAGERVAPLALGLDATQAIKFTGGTTGRPKGVMQPYRAWNCTIVNQIHCYDFGPEDRYLVAAPLTHGTSTYLLPILAQGGCHVLLDETSPATIVEAFRTRGVTNAATLRDSSSAVPPTPPVRGNMATAAGPFETRRGAILECSCAGASTRRGRTRAHRLSSS